MRPRNLVMAVATIVLSGCIWLGVIERTQQLEASSAGSPVVSGERADLLAKNDGSIGAVPMDSRAVLPAARGRDSALLLLIGASLLSLAAGIRRFCSALGDSAETHARREFTSRTRPKEIPVTHSVSRPL
jgi:hypothetical protein